MNDRLYMILRFSARQLDATFHKTLTGICFPLSYWRFLVPPFLCEGELFGCVLPSAPSMEFDVHRLTASILGGARLKIDLTPELTVGCVTLPHSRDGRNVIGLLSTSRPTLHIYRPVWRSLTERLNFLSL